MEEGGRRRRTWVGEGKEGLWVKERRRRRFQICRSVDGEIKGVFFDVWKRKSSSGGGDGRQEGIDLPSSNELDLRYLTSAPFPSRKPGLLTSFTPFFFSHLPSPSRTLLFSLLLSTSFLNLSLRTLLPNSPGLRPHLTLSLPPFFAHTQDSSSFFPLKYAVGVHGYVLVYSIANRPSFELVMTIYEKMLEQTGAEWVPCVVVGNKSDLEAVR